MLYRRYARPLEIMDAAISTGSFNEFVRMVWRKQQSDELFEVWLHKVYDGSTFDQFKRKVLAPQQHRMTKRQIEATVKESFAILEGFKPPEGVSA